MSGGIVKGRLSTTVRVNRSANSFVCVGKLFVSQYMYTSEAFQNAVMYPCVSSLCMCVVGQFDRM